MCFPYLDWIDKLIFKIFQQEEIAQTNFKKWNSHRLWLDPFQKTFCSVHKHLVSRRVTESCWNLHRLFFIFCQLTEKQLHYVHNISPWVIFFCNILLTVSMHQRQLFTQCIEISCIRCGLSALYCLLRTCSHVHSNKYILTSDLVSHHEL